MGVLSAFRKKEDVSALLSQLKDDSIAKRQNALDKLEKLQITVEDGLKIIQASKDKYPPLKYEWQDIQAKLIDICSGRPYAEYVDKLDQIFDGLGSQAKLAVYQFLTTYENERALITYLKLLDKEGGKMKRLPTGSLYDRPRFPEILFPRLLSHARNKDISDDIYLVLLNYFNSRMITENMIKDYRNSIAEDILNSANEVSLYMQEKLKGSIWDDEDYMGLRNRAGVHLDLAGYISNPRIILVLRNMMSTGDMRLKMFAALSLLRLGEGIEAEDALEIAADSEMRNWFYNGLQNIGQKEIFPVQYENQASFAESNMVDWLTYPTELGRVPDRIELMNVFEDGENVYYLFRFRCISDGNWREEGWMAGVSGPYAKKEEPSTKAGGHTFSRFEKWDSKTPKEHFASIVGNVKEFWMKRAEELK